MNETRLIETVSAFYEAATEPDTLEQVGAVMRDAMDVGSGIMFVCERQNGAMQRLLSCSENFDDRARADYAAHFHGQNVWFNRALLRRPPYCARGEELVADAEFERTGFYTDWCRRIGIRHMIGGVEPVGEGLVLGSGLHHTIRQGAFDETQKRQYALLMGHLGHAVRLGLKLAARQQVAPDPLLESLHALDIGVILVDVSGRPHFVNAVAGRLISARRWFTLRGGALASVHPGETAALAAVIRRSAATARGDGLHPGGALRLRDPVSGPLAVMVSPFRSRTLPGQAFAAVMFADPDRRTAAPEAEAVAVAFGLTEAEARLVSALAGGLRLTSAAKRLGISVNTAKTQLASAFARTGHSRQTELVRDVCLHPLVRLMSEKAAEGSGSGLPERPI